MIKKARYSVGVAEHGSFSRASVELGISQSAPTGAIVELDGHLDLKLVDRRRGGGEIGCSAP